jgi:hypothetical protein
VFNTIACWKIDSNPFTEAAAPSNNQEVPF